MSLILRALSRCTMHGPLNRFGRHYPIAQSSRIRRPFVSQRRKGKTGPTPPESLKNETAPSGKHRRPPGLGRRLLGYLLFRTFGLRKASGFKSSMQRRTESRLAKLKYTKIINKKRRFQPGLLKDFFPGFRWVDMAAFGAIMAAQLVGVRARDHRATVQVRVGDVQMNRFWLLPLAPFAYPQPDAYVYGFPLIATLGLSLACRMTAVQILGMYSLAGVAGSLAEYLTLKLYVKKRLLDQRKRGVRSGIFGAFDSVSLAEGMSYQAMPLGSSSPGNQAIKGAVIANYFYTLKHLRPAFPGAVFLLPNIWSIMLIVRYYTDITPVREMAAYTRQTIATMSRKRGEQVGALTGFLCIFMMGRFRWLKPVIVGARV